MVIGFGPLIISLLALLIPPLIAPIDGRWWEISTGGRPPEQDEQEAFEHAIEELREYDPKLRAPRHWFVAEDPDRNAAAYAKTMRIDRGLLESPHAIAAVIAHELGHLNSGDGRFASAVRLMLIADMPPPSLYPLSRSRSVALLGSRAARPSSASWRTPGRCTGAPASSPPTSTPRASVKDPRSQAHSNTTRCHTSARSPGCATPAPHTPTPSNASPSSAHNPSPTQETSNENTHHPSTPRHLPHPSTT